MKNSVRLGGLTCRCEINGLGEAQKSHKRNLKIIIDDCQAVLCTQEFVYVCFFSCKTSQTVTFCN